MIRISGGLFRGRYIKCPKAGYVRPATNQVRQAIFNHLGDIVRDANVIDLFAGCGTLGIEALSRGASTCIFVEKRKLLCKAIRDNLKALGLESHAHIINEDVFRYEIKGSFHLIFADPPFRQFSEARMKIAQLLLNARKNLAHHGRLILRIPRLCQDNSIEREATRVLLSGESKIVVFPTCLLVNKM